MNSKADNHHTRQAVKVILKTEPKRHGGAVIAFLPDQRANYGQIAYIGSAHNPTAGEFNNLCFGEAPLDYYHACKPYKGNLAEHALERVAYYGTRGNPDPVTRVYRQTAQDRKTAWARG